MQSGYEELTILITKLKEEKDIERYFILLNDIIKLTIDLCNYFFENNELNPILQFYREISLGYKKALDIIENSELSEAYYSLLEKSYKYWKNNEQIIQKELMKLNIHEGNLFFLEGK